MPKHIPVTTKPILHHNKSKSSIPPSESINAQRIREMREHCLSEGPSYFTLMNYNHFMYSEKHNFLYCHIQKAGSTFWGRLIVQMNRKNMKSPYLIKPQYNLNSVKSRMATDARKKVARGLKTMTKFLFVRNPYHRLFSGYIDKIYSPNPTYWKILGKYIVQKFRKGTPKSHCGHDVTFHEYFQFAIHSETTKKHEDMHTSSFCRMCNPCKVKFDIIGKMETFKDDTNYILDKLHMGSYKNTLINMTEDTITDALYDVAQAYIEMRKEALNCISNEKIIQKIWRKLQIRGLVSVHIPVASDLVDMSTDIEVFNIFKDAYANSSRKMLKRQKHLLMVEAFRTIPLSNLYKYAEVFKKDFELFGYDPYPPEIFQRSNLTDVHYGYFDV